MDTYLMFFTVHNKLFQRKKKQGGGETYRDRRKLMLEKIKYITVFISIKNKKKKYQ